MQSLVKQPILWVGLIILVIALVILSGRFSEEGIVSQPSTNKSVINESSANNSGAMTADNIASDELTVNDAKHPEHNHGQADEHQAEGDKMPRHQDMLSEEMKQAIRNQLILHGPKKTFEKNDGTVVFPSGGRSTQVTVAVQMPDGTIQIREYSELPEDSKPIYKVSDTPLKD